MLNARTSNPCWIFVKWIEVKAVLIFSGVVPEVLKVALEG